MWFYREIGLYCREKAAAIVGYLFKKDFWCLIQQNLDFNRHLCFSLLLFCLQCHLAHLLKILPFTLSRFLVFPSSNRLYFSGTFPKLSLPLHLCLQETVNYRMFRGLGIEQANLENGIMYQIERSASYAHSPWIRWFLLQCRLCVPFFSTVKTLHYSNVVMFIAIW